MKYTTIMVLNYLKGVVIQDMLSICKATGNCHPSGDFFSARKYNSWAASKCSRLWFTWSLPASQGSHVIWYLLWWRFTLTFVSVLLDLSNVVAVSQSEVKVWRLIPAAPFISYENYSFCFWVPFFGDCMTRLNITSRWLALYIIHQSKNCFNIHI